MLEIAAVVMAVSLAVLAGVAVVAFLQVTAAANAVRRLAETVEGEVRPLARELTRTAEHAAEVMAVVKTRCRKTDEVLEGATRRMSGLGDRLIRPAEAIAVVLEGASMVVGKLWRFIRKEGRQ